eukprot:m.726031 g.726031  ORF g.726031 m.726031 type:complete len:326 (+) comp23028_c0_seq51:201-1178(+)
MKISVSCGLVFVALLSLHGAKHVHGQGTGSGDLVSDDAGSGTDCPFSESFASNESVPFPCSVPGCPTSVGDPLLRDCCAAVTTYCSATTVNGCQESDIIQLVSDCEIDVSGDGSGGDSDSTASPTSASPTTAAPTSASPTSASPTSASPTTASPTTIAPTTPTRSSTVSGSTVTFTPGPRVIVITFPGDLTTLSTNQREDMIAQIKADIVARSDGRLSATDLIVILRSGSINAEVQFQSTTPNSDISVLSTSIQENPMSVTVDGSTLESTGANTATLQSDDDDDDNYDVFIGFIIAFVIAVVLLVAAAVYVFQHQDKQHKSESVA